MMRIIAAVCVAVACVQLTLVQGAYVGCFRDDRNYRDLSATGTSPALYNTQMTVEMCVGYCRRLGYCFAGVQFASECYCGTSYGKYGLVSDSTCFYTCAGDGTEKCGGASTNSVYTTDCVQPAPPTTTTTTTAPVDICTASQQQYQNGGFLQYPSDRQTYRSNLYCQWRITAPYPNLGIEVSFLNSISIENHPNCAFDWLSIQTLTGREVKRYCGDNVSPANEVFPYSDLMFVFHSDSQVQGTGFSLFFNYRALPTPMPTTTTTTTTTTTSAAPTPVTSDSCVMLHYQSPRGGLVKYPLAADTYPSSVQCIWLIGTPSTDMEIDVTISMMDIESSSSCAYDALSFSLTNQANALDKLCGNYVPAKKHYRTNLLMIKFNSDQIMQGRGFQFSYNFVPCVVKK